MTEQETPSGARSGETADQAHHTKPRGLRAGVAGIKSNVTSLFDAGKVITRLAPKQLKDEVEIAKIELKTKGVALGKGVAVVAVGLLFGLFLLIALVSAAILGLGKVVEPWLAALILAGVFLILLAIFGLIGYRMIKSQLPIKPESAIFGILYDIGVLKHGSDMTSSRLKQEQREKEAAKEAERAEAAKRDAEAESTPAAPAPSEEQLKQRTKQRRDHLKSLRDDLNSYSNNVSTQARGLVENAKQSAVDLPSTMATRTKVGAQQLVDNATNPEVVQTRWKPFAVLIASVSALVVFIKKLMKR